MALVRYPQDTLPKIAEAYRTGKNNMVLQSLNFRGYQNDIIEILAEDSGARGKADVVRMIIDEWVEAKLRNEGLL